MQIYVEAPSKKAIRDRFANGIAFYGEHYNLQGKHTIRSNEFQPGDVIKVFSKRIGGTPYAKAYGTIARTKTGSLTIK